MASIMASSLVPTIENLIKGEHFTRQLTDEVLEICMLKGPP